MLDNKGSGTILSYPHGSVLVPVAIRFVQVITEGLKLLDFGLVGFLCVVLLEEVSLCCNGGLQRVNRSG